MLLFGTGALLGAIGTSPNSENYITGVIVLSMISGMGYTIGLCNIIKIIASKNKK